MRNPADIVAPALPQPERSAATRALHGACRTLRTTSADLVRSIQLTFDLDDLPMSPGSATEFAQRIAMEYGVVARACAGEKWITVYLTRDVAPSPRTATNTRHEVKGWAWRFFSWLSR